MGSDIVLLVVVVVVVLFFRTLDTKLCNFTAIKVRILNSEMNTSSFIYCVYYLHFDFLIFVLPIIVK